MPRELVAIAPREPVIREYELPELQPNQVRVRSQFSAPKHGTELGMYRGTSAFSRGTWDPELLIFRRREGEPPGFPMHLGNMAVGIVTEVGAQVTRFKVGDRVFGHMPIREVHTVREDRLLPAPEGMSPEAIVYWDPAEFALGAVRDANIRLGERVAIFGMGAIGLMAAQMAKLSGAEWLAVVDPLENRRQAALRHGAHAAYDPREVDVGETIKRETGGGVDVAIEASGAYPALHEAIRCTHLCGLVVPLAFYEGDARGLFLGEEWHMNRITMRSSRSISDPNRDHPMWHSKRIADYAFQLLREGRLSVEGLVSPIVPFDECADAYRRIDEAPGESIKLGIVHEQ